MLLKLLLKEEQQNLTATTVIDFNIDSRPKWSQSL